MRLITYEGSWSLKLVEYEENDLPQYAILSHTWGPDGEEVTFKDFTESDIEGKAGYRKLAFCCKQAARDGIQHFWIDTCCIDKSSSAELTEAINSMFHWYKRASKCYVYLSDVPNPEHSPCISQSPAGWDAAFRRSRWFTRGWTLQELIAPELVEFFAEDGSFLGSKISLEQPIHEITGISSEILRGGALADVEVEERLSWAKHRETKRPEDKAYSLCGMFNIRMSLFYGEGRDEAFNRLRRKIGKSLMPPRESLEIIPSPPRSLTRSTKVDLPSNEQRCMGWCSCRCHRILNLKSPQLLSSSVGDFSIRFGTERSGCNESSCKRRSKSTTFITYRFPKWLTNSAIHLSLASTALSIESNLKMLRIIPDSAEIFGALSAGDLLGMQKLFELGKASIHDVDQHNWTLLHRAFLLQKEEVCRFLLTQGADAYVEADNGSSVVERAWFLAQSKAKSFTESVVYDSDILTQVDLYDYVQSQQYTPIHKIILGLSKLQLSQYLETSTDGINTPDAGGGTPLIWASVKGNNAAVQLLLNYGANPNMAGRIKQTPLHIARNSQVVRSLLDYGADTEARDTSGRTPLHTYSYRQTATDLSVVKEILAGGANINAKTTAGHTALHYAAAFGNTHLIPILYENGISLDETKNSGDTALALAVRYNQVDAIRLLLQRSANVALQNEQGQSVVHIGACFGRVETLEALATCDLTGLSITNKDKRGFSPVDYFESREDRSPELEGAFAKLVAFFAAPGDDQNGIGESAQLDDITEMDEVPPIPGAF